MRPTLRQLQYLIAIADTGRFSDAAKRLHVSQPSLSTQIAEMEAELDCALLERGRARTFLTPVGEEVVRRARRILSEVEDMKAVTRETALGLAGRLRLGVLPSVGPYLLPTATKRLHTEFPELRLLVSEEKTEDLETHLTNGAFDIIISTPEDHSVHVSEPLFEEKLWICAAPDHALSQSKDPIPLSSLQGLPLLSLGPGHRLSQLIAELAREAGGRVGGEYQGTSLDATRQMAVMGSGVAVLPSLYVKLEAQRDKDITVRPISDDMARRTISLIWRRQSPLSNKFSALAAMLRETAQDLLK